MMRRSGSTLRGIESGLAVGGFALALDSVIGDRAVLVVDAAAYLIAAAVLTALPATVRAPRPTGRRLQVLHDCPYTSF